MMIDRSKIKIKSELDVSLLNQTQRGRNLINRYKSTMVNDDIWLLSSLGYMKFDLKELVDFLFKYGLDVFYIEYGSINKIYICLIDAYRIHNSVVYSIKRPQLSR